MREIERHIVELLLDNDCVIVPGFGGFMTHNIPASYDEKNNIFLPPSRTIGFNPRLTMNDSLLTQSYANCYDLSYPEALKRIEQDVDDLKQLIEEKGVYTICGIGQISIHDDGQYDFTPESSGIITPCLYGFETFEFSLLDMKDDNNIDATAETTVMQVEPHMLTSKLFTADTEVLTQAKKEEPAPQKSQRKEIAIHIPLNFVQRAAVACVMLFVLLSFPSRLGEARTSILRQSSIGTDMLLEIFPKEMTSGKPQKLDCMLDSILPKIKASGNDKHAEMRQNEESEEKRAPYYSIVMASRITPKNAEAYVEKLHKKGLTDAYVNSCGGLTKVVYKKFATREDANRTMNSLKGNNLFDGSWVVEIK